MINNRSRHKEEIGSFFGHCIYIINDCDTQPPVGRRIVIRAKHRAAGLALIVVRVAPPAAAGRCDPDRRALSRNQRAGPQPT